MNLDKISTLEELKKAKAKFYSKEGKLAELQAKIKSADPLQKNQIGKEINKLKQDAEFAFKKANEKIIELEIEQKIKNTWIDVTKPFEKNGLVHPLEIVSQRFRNWFLQNGYYETTGSEIESDKYNFEHLNVPQDHPARDMQDSLYINSKKLLRTHNTGFTARELEKNKNQAFSQFTIGKVYRNDDDDQTHSHQFMQVDLVSVGHLSFPNLMWTLKSLLSYVLEQEVKIRLRPSFFPFTEPSTEVDILYKGKWIEVLGAGMLHDQVLKKAQYTNDMNGFAAGVGIERIAMIKYGIDEIREFYKNDLRFLNQFKEAK